MGNHHSYTHLCVLFELEVQIGLDETQHPDGRLAEEAFQDLQAGRTQQHH